MAVCLFSVFTNDWSFSWRLKRRTQASQPAIPPSRGLRSSKVQPSTSIWYKTPPVIPSSRLLLPKAPPIIPFSGLQCLRPSGVGGSTRPVIGASPRFLYVISPFRGRPGAAANALAPVPLFFSFAFYGDGYWYYSLGLEFSMVSRCLLVGRRKLSAPWREPTVEASSLLASLLGS